MNYEFTDLRPVSNETAFRKTVTAVGLSLISLVLFFNSLYGLPTLFLSSGIFGMSEAVTEIVCSLAESVVYILCLLLPILVFKIIMGKSERTRPFLGVSADAGLFLVIPAVVGLNTAISFLNFEIFSFLPSAYATPESALPDSVNIILELIGTALIPAVFEELYFRGCILTNLLPYGKTGAVFISAFTFALMHGSFQKFLHTFCAGLMLGCVYLLYRSIWPGVLIHFFNNLISVMSYGWIGKASGIFAAVPMLVTELAIMTAGLAFSALFLIRLYKKKPPMPLSYVPVEDRPVENYLSNAARPTLIIYTVLAVVMAAGNVLYAIFYF